MTRAALVGLACLAFHAALLRADTIYVDGRVGEDRYDGLSPRPVSEFSGPVRTLRRAVQLANGGDRIVLAPAEVPYDGSVSFVGDRHSGADARPFVIEGNGAVLSGAKPVPVGTWRLVGRDLWRVTPVRKAHYQLVADGQALPEVECPRDAPRPPELPVGHWCAWRGAVYFRTAPGAHPDALDMSLAGEEVGITLLDVNNVIIRDVTLRHYRLDGINAHDRCRNVILENVVSEQNGRAGIAVAGTSQVAAFQCRARDNRVYSVLITEKGAAFLEDCELDRPPSLAGNGGE